MTQSRSAQKKWSASLEPIVRKDRNVLTALSALIGRIGPSTSGIASRNAPSFF
jgi:hypothetical protein